jgi:hypothetical protein
MGQCMFKKNATIKLTFGMLSVLYGSFFFPFFIATAFFKKRPVSPQLMMDWQGGFFEGACFYLSAGGF